MQRQQGHDEVETLAPNNFLSHKLKPTTHSKAQHPGAGLMRKKLRGLWHRKTGIQNTPGLPKRDDPLFFDMETSFFAYWAHNEAFRVRYF